MVLGIKEPNKKELSYIEKMAFSKDNREDDLHEIVENNPDLVYSDISDSKLILLASKENLNTGKQLDLLFCGEDATIVIIELKRDKSPRDAISQLIDYAATINKLSAEELITNHSKYKSIKDLYLKIEEPTLSLTEFKQALEKNIKNPILLLVSYSIDEGVKRQANYLREHNTPINCVEFDYYKNKDFEFFVPNVIGSEETKQLSEKVLTKSQKQYKKFYSIAIEQFKTTLPNVTNRGPTKGTWLKIPIGRTDIHLEWSFRGKNASKKLLVSLDFENKDREKNLKYLDTFQAKQNELEKKLGKNLVFNQNFGTNWTRIFTELKVGTLENAIKDKKVHDWAVDTMVNFYKTLTPLVENLDTE